MAGQLCLQLLTLPKNGPSRGMLVFEFIAKEHSTRQDGNLPATLEPATAVGWGSKRSDEVFAMGFWTRWLASQTQACKQ